MILHHLSPNTQTLQSQNLTLFYLYLPIKNHSYLLKSPIQVYQKNSILSPFSKTSHMNTLKPRMSYDITYSNQFRGIQEHVEPSTQAKQLIQYLKSNPNPDINRKLRQEIFFKKVLKPNSDITQLKRSSSQSKLQVFDKQTDSNEEKKNFFINKADDRKKGGFFSPKAQRQRKPKPETTPFVAFQAQQPENGDKKFKNSFRLRRDVMSLNQELVHSTKQITFDKKSRECPYFLKKGPKTTQNLKPVDDEDDLKIQDFVILKNLGQGTFGQVFAAIHKPTHSIYTIKKYKKQIIKTHELEEKFIHDIKVQLKTIHPHIVKLYGFFDDEIYFYMVFEYMESGNLVKTIEKMGGKLPQVQVCRKIYQINEALLFLHEKNIIHRDIKPASILTCLNVCKLCDTEWIQQNDDTAHHNTLCKQIDYTAPQALEGKQITPEFDVWGLGLIAFELLTGKKFIVGNTQKLLIRKIITLKKQLIEVMIPKSCSESLRHLILSALEPVPSKRMKTSQINEMKIQKQKQLATMLLSNKPLTFSEKSLGFSEKSVETRGSPKNGIIFGVKKQIKNEVSTLL